MRVANVGSPGASAPVKTLAHDVGLAAGVPGVFVRVGVLTGGVGVLVPPPQPAPWVR
jgi:hypothetical protein